MIYRDSGVDLVDRPAAGVDHGPTSPIQVESEFRVT